MIAATSDKELQIIKSLNEMEENFRLNTNQNILDKQGITEEILEFQKPVLDEIKQVNENLLAVTDGNQEQGQIITSS